MWYKVDIYKFGQHLMPPVLRKKRLFSLLSVLLLPFAYMAESFLLFRYQSRNKLKTNGQVIYIEKVLNDHFLLTGKEIYLSDIEDRAVYLYRRSEGQIPLYLYKDMEGDAFLRYGDEGSYEGNFIVHIPSFLKDYETEIRNLTNFYKPAGRNFKIEIYDYE